MERESRMREDALAIFRAGLAAADPRAAVHAALKLEGDTLRFGEGCLPLGDHGRILVVGAGKAGTAMAAAVEEILGERISAGLLVTKYGHGRPLRHIEILEAAHPVPDEKGVEGARRIGRLLETTEEGDVVLCLISGGGSALLPAPPGPISLDDKMTTTKLLLESGADIEAVNAVRKHLSTLKGGGLARLADPATVITLILSDVVGDPLDAVASGPTVPDPTTFADALTVIERHGLEERLPPSVLQWIAGGKAEEREETPKPGDPIFERVHNLLVGNNARSVGAAAEEAERRGYRSMVLSTTVTGESRHIAAMHAAMAREIAATGRPGAPPLCLLSGGETTVTLRGEGKGGRNQEFVLAAALEIAALPRALILAGGTDGTDGPTDAAGALADGSTLVRARQAGLDPRAHLDNNDAYPFFQRLDDLVITGPTGTNVMDIYMVLIGEPQG